MQLLKSTKLLDFTKHQRPQGLKLIEKSNLSTEVLMTCYMKDTGTVVPY